jgi:hypothetical protein
MGKADVEETCSQLAKIISVVLPKLSIATEARQQEPPPPLMNTP